MTMFICVFKPTMRNLGAVFGGFPLAYSLDFSLSAGSAL